MNKLAVGLLLNFLLIYSTCSEGEQDFSKIEYTLLEKMIELSYSQKDMNQMLHKHMYQQGRCMKEQTETEMDDLCDTIKSSGEQIKQLQEVQKLHIEELKKLKQAREAKAISTYVRWGRSDCPANITELVYAGAVGGSNYNDYGGASNFLCLSLNPSWMKYKDGNQSKKNAFIYGTEYRFNLRIGEFFQPSLYGQEVPCAVCKSPNPANLMIPGQTTCPSGWRVEYKGYLVTTHPNNKVSGEYICLDEDPEPLEGSSSSHNEGVILYVVEAQCGSLHCLPYVSGRELTCVVCSR